MMTLLDKERELIREIDFFNRNLIWWMREFDRVNKRMCQIEQEHYINTNGEEIDGLMARLAYLAGKAKVEQQTAFEIEKKLYKLNLQKQLFMIQGDLNYVKPRRKHKH